MKIYPFRGLRYDPEVAGDMENLVTQPYDKIPETLQANYHDRSEYSFVRIIKGMDKSADSEADNKYTRAAEAMEQWTADGVLKRDATPCLYVYHQITETPGKEPVRRKGFTAAAGLEDFSGGGVRPHEATHAAPKADRLNLARATKSHTGPIFMLYDEPEKDVNKLLDAAIAGVEPAYRLRDDFGCLHEFWAVSDPDIVGKVSEKMAGAKCMIADGHHRYETALNFREEMRAGGKKCTGADSFENALVTFINLHDPALLIYPGHRVCFDLVPEQVETLLSQAADLFDLESLPVPGDLSSPEAENAIRSALSEAGKNAPAFGLYTGGDFINLLTLKDAGAMDRFTSEERSPAWKSLDVSVLHTLLLENFLKIDAADLEHERKVRYARHIAEAMGQVDEGKAQLCFLLNPTKVEQVRDVALAGEKMPPKSTDFFPKLLSGLVTLKMAFEDE